MYIYVHYSRISKCVLILCLENKSDKIYEKRVLLKKPTLIFYIQFAVRKLQFFEHPFQFLPWGYFTFFTLTSYIYNKCVPGLERHNNLSLGHMSTLDLKKLIASTFDFKERP